VVVAGLVAGCAKACEEFARINTTANSVGHGDAMHAAGAAVAGGAGATKLLLFQAPGFAAAQSRGLDLT
jgi:hypothetical protein